MASIKFTDVKPMIENKILRNNLAKSLLESHVDIFEREVEIRKLYIDSCKAKIHMLDTMNAIEQMQLNEYDKSREETILETAKELEEMDSELIGTIKTVQEQIQTIKSKSEQLSKNIVVLNQAIPKEGIATNYKIKYKDTLAGRCVP